MLKRILLLLTVIAAFALATPQAYAEQQAEQQNNGQELMSQTYDELLKNSGGEGLLNSLSPQAKQSLQSMGINNGNPAEIADLSPQDVLLEIINQAAAQADVPMKTSISIIAIMLLYSVFAGFKDSLGNTAHAETLNIVITLAITCTLVVPIANLITLAAGAIVNAANFMLILVPVMAVLMISAGRAMSGGSYYTMMMAVCQGVSQLAAKVITPMLNIFLGLSVVSAAAPAVNIGGLTNRLGKIIKWCICFLMTIFTGVLSLKSMITGSADSVSSRVAKFSISSFVPLVGSSLSEAYQTVQGGVALVKSGLGVVSIFSVAIMFLPVIIQCVIFLVTINLTKGIGDVLNFGEPLKLLDAVCTVLSTLLAIIFAIAAVFIISTAITVMAGGGTQ